MARSKLSDRDARHDRFHKRARKEGFASRAVFKLEEIDRKLGLIQPGARICDLGCAPGSWLQYAAKQAGRKAALVGIDRVPVDLGLENARTLVGDVFAIDPQELLGELAAFDVVLSDMAPDTIGVRHVDQARSEALFERALDIASATLAPGGGFVGKLFQGPDFQKLVQRCRREFGRVKIVKPEGSRTASIEQYVGAIGFRGAAP